MTEPPRTGPDFKTLESDGEWKRKKKKEEKGEKKRHVEGFDFRSLPLSLSTFLLSVSREEHD